MSFDVGGCDSGKIKVFFGIDDRVYRVLVWVRGKFVG